MGTLVHSIDVGHTLHPIHFLLDPVRDALVIPNPRGVGRRLMRVLVDPHLVHQVLLDLAGQVPILEVVVHHLLTCHGHSHVQPGLVHRGKGVDLEATTGEEIVNILHHSCTYGTFRGLLLLHQGLQSQKRLRVGVLQQQPLHGSLDHLSILVPVLHPGVVKHQHKIRGKGHGLSLWSGVALQLGPPGNRIRPVIPVDKAQVEGQPDTGHQGTHGGPNGQAALGAPPGHKCVVVSL
mmetsp:Transcript_93251/g.213149  ORF Transcript_93251/g.213149 Transcript_93251/m.213149 type:complete len:235 (-) Transcript_93251:420-1124(-)